MENLCIDTDILIDHTLFLFYKKKTCAKRKINFFVKTFFLNRAYEKECKVQNEKFRGAIYFIFLQPL